MLNRIFSIFKRIHTPRKTKKNVKRKPWKFNHKFTYKYKGKIYKCPRSGSLPPSQRPKGCPDA